MQNQITPSIPVVKIEDGNIYNAHKNWANRPDDQRFKSMADVGAFLRKQQLAAQTHDVAIQDVVIAATEEGGIALNGAMVKAEPSNWAFSQLARIAAAPPSYLGTLPAHLAVDCLNSGIQGLADGDKVLRWLTRDLDDSGDAVELSAITSTGYGRIWNYDIWKAVQHTLGKMPEFFNPPARNPHTGATEPSGLFASDRDMFLFFINGGSRLMETSLDDGKSALNRGFFIWNSEVGDKSFGLATFLFREVCGNLIVWNASDVQELSFRHSKGAPDRFLREAGPALAALATRNFDKEAAAIKAAQTFALPIKLEDKLAMFRKRGFTGGEIKRAVEAAEREEGRCESLWDFVNGVTASARSYAHIDAKTDLETRAGKLFDLVN